MVDNYLLRRDVHGSIRLNAQHLLWRIYNGYVLNPAISRSGEMKIAEIVISRGFVRMWLLDLASQLPQSVQLDGFDLSEEQFPHQDIWPVNITFNKLDAFGDVPDHVANKYDVVHLRLWSGIVRNNDPSRLIRHAAGLLKPGGYLQWEDADLGKTVFRGETAEQVAQVARSIFRAESLQFDWLSNIQAHVRQQGLDILSNEIGEIPPSLVPLCTTTYLAGLGEIFRTTKAFRELQTPDDSRYRVLLLELLAAVRQGAAYHWSPVTLLAQKPS